MKLFVRVLIALLEVATATYSLSAQQTVVDSGRSRSSPRGWNLYLEEDLFYRPRNEDRNYTGGIGIQFTTGSPRSPQYLLLYGVNRLTRADRLHLGRQVDVSSGMLTLTAFTPDSLRAVDIIPDDRPYASLLAWTAKRLSVALDERSSWRTEATLGVLGLHLARNGQRYIHKSSRAGSGKPTPYDPKGWSHQVSDGGEPTVLYTLGYDAVLIDPPRKTTGRLTQKRLFQATYGWQALAGYYTEVSGSLGARLGVLRTDFWEFKTNPMGGTTKAMRGEFPLDAFLFGAVRPRLIGYNALLQGQFRDTDLRVPANDITRLVTEFDVGGEIGVNIKSHRYAATVVYPAGRTKEFRGPRSRTHTWASVFFTVQPLRPVR